ncbi:MAG TPA: hypothetical protein VFH29_02775, partial [Anaerolineales bacterium]|nr:hypothetical protein [Anaerolineales bacterium]
LPGLPMFAHGQMDGLRERYGMEYRRAKMDEQPDKEIVALHEKRIFPLLRNRRLFADVKHFHLFDLTTQRGRLNENVFAFSNRRAEERALVLFNNKDSRAKGWIQTSSAGLHKGSRRLLRHALGEALHLPRTGFAVFKDTVTGLEYIRACEELWARGMRADLGPYQSHVFLNWRIVHGAAWKAVCVALNGAGVDSLQGMLEGMSVGAALGRAAKTSSSNPKKPTRKLRGHVSTKTAKNAPRRPDLKRTNKAAAATSRRK